MKKSIFTKVSFLLIFSGFCSAQAVENAAEESSALISIDEIAQELESEEALPDVSVEEVIEEEVFDSDTENEAAASESLLLPVNDKAWRGKTAVAAENEFPKGIFAMAKGYFPGDTLNVINSKTQKTTNVLIIGSIDQYDDIGIKFSAEAAAEIKITDKTDANVILDERKNPPEMREVASAKLVIFGQDENDYSAFSQPVSIAEDEEILTAEADAVEEVAVISESEESAASDEIVENPVGDIAEVFEEDNTEVSDEEASDSYAPIILNVPESVEELAEQEEEKIEEDAEPEKVCEVAAVEEVKTEEVPEPNSEPVKTIDVKRLDIKPCKKEAVPYKKLIANESMVRKGCYIQLAFLANENNLQKFVDNYSDSLKLFLIAHKNGYKIFAGVFDEDDKVAALEYVKSLGFKDAFVRKMGK